MSHAAISFNPRLKIFDGLLTHYYRHLQNRCEVRTFRYHSFQPVTIRGRGYLLYTGFIPLQSIHLKLNF